MRFRVWIFCLLAACRLCAAPVVVVPGQSSVQESERRYAASLAAHVERWYKQAGVPVDRGDDTNLSSALRNRKVAVLVYMASPSASQLAELTAFVKRGGKLIVCYSSSPGLAGLMGVKSVGYKKGTSDGRWSQMRFTDDAPRGTPRSVAQISRNLFLVAPIPGRSKVLAWWHDRAGNQTTEPAWLASSAGYWMTHVMQADGDSEAKGRLLLALAASHDGTIWQQAATSAMKQSLALKNQLAPRLASNHTPRVIKAWQSVTAAARTGEAQLRSGKSFEAWNTAASLRVLCYEAYGVAQLPRKGEIRAVWDHSGMGLYPGDWPRTCSLLKSAGISDLYVNVAGAGFARYASDVLPRSQLFQEQGDLLAECVRAAKANGLRVHAWILCFSTEGATADRIAIFRQRGWLLNPDNARPWLDPSIPEVRNYLVRAAREMAVKYRIDGVHLDFVRYPDFPSSLGNNVKSRFRMSFKQDPVLPNWPEEVKSGAWRQQFIQWRARQISDFVQDVRRTLRRDAPGKTLTAAVYGKYPSCLDAVGQDWEAWLNIGLVDYVAPMNYTGSLAKFNEWLAMQTRTPKLTAKVLPGIGVTAAESRLDAMQVVDQILSVRRAGCPGFVLFDLDTTLRQEILPVLRMGLTAPVK